MRFFGRRAPSTTPDGGTVVGLAPRAPAAFTLRDSRPPLSEDERVFTRATRIALASLQAAGAYVVCDGEYESRVFARTIDAGVRASDAHERALAAFLERRSQRERHPITVSDERLFLLARSAEGELPCRALLAVTFMMGKSSGYLCVVDTKPRRWCEDDVSLLQATADTLTELFALKSADPVPSTPTPEVRDVAADSPPTATEEALRAALAEAEFANAAKANFLARASHELRTPLNSVIGFANILRRNKHGTLHNDELTYIDRIARNGQHLLALVNDILDLAKLEHGEMKLELAPVSLFDVMHEVQDAIAPKAHKFGLDFFLELPASFEHADFTIISDEKRLRQILLNIAGNAVQYTEHGFVTVRLRVNELGAPIGIEVEDTGSGMAADKLLTLFDAFAGVEAPGRDHTMTGLGLAVTRSLCSELGYDLGVESFPGRGTTVTLSLGASRVRGGLLPTPPSGVLAIPA